MAMGWRSKNSRSIGSKTAKWSTIAMARRHGHGLTLVTSREVVISFICESQTISRRVGSTGYFDSDSVTSRELAEPVRMVPFSSVVPQRCSVPPCARGLLTTPTPARAGPYLPCAQFLSSTCAAARPARPLTRRAIGYGSRAFERAWDRLRPPAPR